MPQRSAIAGLRSHWNARRRPRSHRRRWPARSDLGRRWPSRLVATAAEDRLNIWRQPAIAEAIAIYEYTPKLKGRPGPVGGTGRGFALRLRLAERGRRTEHPPALCFSFVR